jgi:hypothetical protein
MQYGWAPPLVILYTDLPEFQATKTTAQSNQPLVDTSCTIGHCVRGQSIAYTEKFDCKISQELQLYYNIEISIKFMSHDADRSAFSFDLQYIVQNSYVLLCGSGSLPNDAALQRLFKKLLAMRYR